VLLLNRPIAFSIIRNALDYSTARTIATSLVHSKLDYCKSLLLILNLPKNQLDRLQLTSSNVFTGSKLNNVSDVKFYLSPIVKFRSLCDDGNQLARPACEWTLYQRNELVIFERAARIDTWTKRRPVELLSRYCYLNYCTTATGNDGAIFNYSPSMQGRHAMRTCLISVTYYVFHWFTFYIDT